MLLNDRARYKDLFYKVYDEKLNKIGTKEDLSNLIDFSKSSFDVFGSGINEMSVDTIKGLFIKDVLVYEDLVSYALLHLPKRAKEDSFDYEDDAYMNALFKAVLFYREQWKGIPILRFALESVYEEVSSEPKDYLDECKSVLSQRAKEENYETVLI